MGDFIVEKDCIMAIDIGTQSVRAMVYTKNGECLANARIVSESCHAKHIGWAEAKPYSFWENLCYCTNEAKKQMKGDFSRIAGVSITTNRDNIICLDKDGKPLRDWITWMDQRLCPEAIDKTKRDTKGLSKAIRYAKKSFFDMVSTRSKFNWIKINEPEIFNATHKFLTLCGHMTYMLTGKYHDAIGLQMGVYPFDIKNFKFYDFKAIYEIVGVEREKLADKVFQSGEIMGYINHKASIVTGLPEGLPVIAAGADKQCETIGAGCLGDDDAVISYGTMAAVTLTTDTYVSRSDLAFYTWASSYPGKWAPEFYVDRGYWLVTWFCKQYAREKDTPEFLRRINEAASKIPPGCNGLVVFPFWAPHYVLYPKGKGAVLGFSDDHTPAHLYKAILESIAYALKDGLNLIEKTNHKKTKRLIVVGGGSKSDIAMQLTADIFNKEVVRIKQSEIGAIGAVAIAGAATGLYASLEDGIETLTKIDKVFKPIAENVKIYNALYNDVYRKIYLSNLKAFKTLQDYSKLEVDSQGRVCNLNNFPAQKNNE